MRVDMQGPVWLSGGEDGFYASAFFLGLLVILAWGVQRRFPSRIQREDSLLRGVWGSELPVGDESLSPQLVRTRGSPASGVVMSLMSAAFARATMPDNNAMHQTRREGVALASVGGQSLRARLAGDCVLARPEDS